MNTYDVFTYIILNEGDGLKHCIFICEKRPSYRLLISTCYTLHEGDGLETASSY